MPYRSRGGLVWEVEWRTFEASGSCILCLGYCGYKSPPPTKPCGPQNRPIVWGTSGNTSRRAFWPSRKSSPGRWFRSAVRAEPRMALVCAAEREIREADGAGDGGGGGIDDGRHLFRPRSGSRAVTRDGLAGSGLTVPEESNEALVDAYDGLEE